MVNDLPALRRRCAARLHHLALPVPFDLERFCALLAERRGRPLHVRPVAAGLGPHGFWAATTSADYVFYAEETSPLHRLHIILHELAHIVCAHRPPRLEDVPFPTDLFSDLDPETVRLLLQRAAYSTEEEREAEVLATMLLERAGSLPDPGTLTLDAETAWLRERIAAAQPRDSENAR
jgi:hypothetical protein